jgi:hypothetical protein
VLVLGRYRLVDKVTDDGASSFWRAVDERLRRPIGVRVMPVDHPLAASLREAARQASLVTDRRAVHVLDVAEDTERGLLVVVTEWLAATGLGDLLTARGGEPLPPRDAATIALEVALFVAAAEEAGVPHGRLRPNSVLVSDSGEVRVRGLAIDRALHGTEPDVDPLLADVHGAGAVLYAGLTGRWPGPVPVPELAPAPVLEQDRVPWPSRVRADVPTDLDVVAARALLTTARPKGRSPFTRVGEVVEALTGVLTTAPAAAPDRARTAWRAATVVIAAVAVLGLLLGGISLVRGAASPPLVSPRASTAAPSTPAASPPAGGTAAPVERPIAVVSAADFDPFGDTREENPQLAPLAIDDDPASAWKTVRYRQEGLSGKPGVGLLLDLGAPRPVSAVQLRLVGLGTDVSLRAGDDPTADPEQFEVMAEAVRAGDEVTLRVPRPVTTRYLLVWLTELPSAGGAYQGGVSDVVVRG